ncbi:MAG: TIGR00730 family Rossman fold protein [Campylobacter sp.]|nr:TIGR00730 family Rossman fold protein [Campylobacter sp.]
MDKDLLSDIELKNALLFPEKCVTFFGSARFDDSNKYCIKACELAKRLASSEYTIITGGGGGIMKAANKGASRAGKDSYGLNIVLPNEQIVNEFVTKQSTFSSLALRKATLIEKARNFVVFPGGFGTLDELFEVLVLVQNGIKEASIYLYGVEFHTPLLEFLENSLVSEKAISKVDLGIFTLTDSIDEIFENITKEEQ